MTLKVPYNFVPLNEKVVKPYWIDHISHDVPFKDGMSGTLQLTLKAESPIFVRRGAAKPPQGNEDKTKAQQSAYEFEQDERGNYFIPGSSLRGMVRSVVETLSFGRMIGRVNERRYAVRDLNNKPLYRDRFPPGETLCGWLKKDLTTGEYHIDTCGYPERISHQQIQAFFGVNFQEFFSSKGKYSASNSYHKSAKHKYELFSDRGLSDYNKKHHDYLAENDSTGRSKKTLYAPLNGGGFDDEVIAGKLVFTGQPGTNNPPKGKYLEFIFPKSNLGEIPVPKQTFDDFTFAYLDHLPESQQSEDYKWRKQQLKKGDPIPVFYKEDFKDGEVVVKHFGLSYLYKLPYDNTVEDSIKNYQKNSAEEHDLADAIFGMVGTNESKSSLDFLKGRVQFSHAKTENKQTKPEEKVILGEPRASFYPTYMKQSGKAYTGRYNTFMNDNPLAGRKRYPVLDAGTRTTNFDGIKPDSPLITRFMPLHTGTTFTCDLHYHNLRPVELGALLSALTFHSTDGSRHQVGMAKPLGFGKVKLTVGETDKFSKTQQAELMLRYEAFMDMELGGDGDWRNSPQVKELLALVTPVDRNKVDVLKGEYPYNALGKFKDVKNNKEALPTHSIAMGGAPEAGLPFDHTGWEAMKAELQQDAGDYAKREPMTSERVDALSMDAGQTIQRKFSDVISENITQLQGELRRLKDEAEAQRIAKNKKRKSEEAKHEGLDLSKVKPGRNSFDDVKKEIRIYLEKLRKKGFKKFSDEDWLLPETDWEELKTKMKEIYANKQAQKRSFSAKQLARTKSEIQRYLGEEKTDNLFQELN